MKKITLTIFCVGFLTLSAFSQGKTGAFNSNDQNAKIDPLPNSPEKLNKVIREAKIKSIIKDKNAVIANHKITFYTTAFYKYSEKSNASMGGKVGDKVKFRLTGVSDNTFQEITDETNKYLIGKLNERGYTLEDYEKITGGKKYAKLKAKSSVAGGEYETQNLYLTKKVTARTFTANNVPVHPPVVGNTLNFGVASESKFTLVVSSFAINFLSIGHTVTNTSDMTHYYTKYGIDVEESVYGSANLEFLTPKMKYGYFASNGFYRYEKLLDYTYSDEQTEDGYNVIIVDEAKYKEYTIGLVNGYFDLMFRNMDEIVDK